MDSMPTLSLGARREGPQVGGSILIASALSHANLSVQLGTASYCVRSRLECN
jgi:hypothetical protein